ncbi:MAG: hypothetical protein ACYS17_12180 [Planctomycetota bacterium]|jgi:colicin import membrane protein
MNMAKQKSLPSQKERDEINEFNHRQPSNEADLILLEALAKQVADSETEAAKAIANIQAQVEELVMLFGAEAQKKTGAYTDKVTNIEAEYEDKDELEEKAMAYEKLLEKYGIEASNRADFEAKVETERQARTEAEAKVKSYAKASIEIMKKLQAQTQAMAEIEEKLKAEIQARHRAEELAEAETQERAKAETRIQIQSKAIANVQAQVEELVMMFRAEALKKTRTYTDKIAKIKAEHKAKTEPKEKVRVHEKLPAKNNAEVRERAESQAKFETESQARTTAEANKMRVKSIVEPRVKEDIYYPLRLSWSQWLFRGIRDDNIAAVIVFCGLLYLVPSALAFSGYFVYTLLHAFL